MAIRCTKCGSFRERREDVCPGCTVEVARREARLPADAPPEVTKVTRKKVEPAQAKRMDRPVARGRPRVEDRAKTLAARKPWEKEGMSRMTWYRRRREKREREARGGT